MNSFENKIQENYFDQTRSKIIFNRRLNYSNHRKNMTVCIAAICESGIEPKILLCADRLVSAGLQFEKGTSKIQRINHNCFALHASSDSLLSEKILDRVKTRTQGENAKFSVKEIVDMFAEECIGLKKEKQEKDVISKYNFVADKAKIDPNKMIDKIMDELDYYPYPNFEFIIAGFDSPDKPRLFKVNEEGYWTCHDSLGFTTTGDGQNLAFPEMTKWYYTTEQSMSLDIPRIYFAKRTSERIQGVGRSTDLAFTVFREDIKTKELVVKFYDISADEGFIEKLDGSFEEFNTSEANIINKLAKDIQKEIDGSVPENETKPASS
jgi:20S proteasome alpha/beta subunit